MSVPFSNTNLRIPRGFGNLLEGLAKEVLRDQPEDIPTFAAHYFTKLLKAREESGLDPAEWGAKLEDRNNAGRSETFGDNETLSSQLKDPNTNISEDTEVKQKYELDKKLDEESGETERGPDVDIPYVGTADVDICAQELKDPSRTPEQTSEVLKDEEVAKEAVDIDICRSELEPTPLPSFGGLANVDVCAEEINHPSESLKLKEGEFEAQDESFVETPSHIEQDVGKQANEMSDDDDDDNDDDDDDGHTEDAEQGILEMADNLLEDIDPEEKSTEQIYVEESTESTTENAVEVKQESEEHTEVKDDLPDNENQEETNHDYSSTNDFVEDAADSTSDINSRSLIEMKDTYIDYSDETYSEVIDVLDEVHHHCSTHTGEHEAENSTDEQNASKMMDAMKKETPKLVNDSETEVTEDMISNEILNTDAVDASEKDLNTENVNEGSDLDSDAEEMDLDISNLPQQNMVKTEDEEKDLTHDTEPVEDILPFEEEEADLRPLEGETEVISEEHLTESQEQTEKTENEGDHEDQLEEQRDKWQESTLERENQENPDSMEHKEECNQPQEEEDIMDIPLDDPEANKAAAKIQAGFRGHMTRKKMKPGEKPNEEVSSSGEGLNGSQGDSAGGTDGVETDATSGPEQ